MRSIGIFVLFILSFFSIASAKEVRVIGVEELIEFLSDSSDNLHVINFWATWCGPCVTELAYFQQLSESYPDNSVSFLLVSLDFPSQLETKLIPFLQDYEINLKVFLMKELDYGKWMPLVDKNWKGNIPATLIFNHATGKREFIAEAMEKKEISRLINLNLE